MKINDYKGALINFNNAQLLAPSVKVSVRKCQCYNLLQLQSRIPEELDMLPPGPLESDKYMRIITEIVGDADSRWTRTIHETEDIVGSSK